MRIFIAFLALSLISLNSARAWVRGDGETFVASAFDSGGAQQDYWDAVLDADRKNQLVVVAGYCGSSCTIFLAAKRVCIAPDAVLYFHSASEPQVTGEMETAQKSPSSSGNAFFLAHYPQPVRDWAIQNNALDTLHLTPEHTLISIQLYAMNFAPCSQGIMDRCKMGLQFEKTFDSRPFGTTSIGDRVFFTEQGKAARDAALIKGLKRTLGDISLMSLPATGIDPELLKENDCIRRRFRAIQDGESFGRNSCRETN